MWVSGHETETSRIAAGAQRRILRRFNEAAFRAVGKAARSPPRLGGPCAVNRAEVRGQDLRKCAQQRVGV